MGHEGSKRPLTHAHITASNHAQYGDYMTGRGTVNIAIKQLGDALFWPTA